METLTYAVGDRVKLVDNDRCEMHWGKKIGVPDGTLGTVRPNPTVVGLVVEFAGYPGKHPIWSESVEPAKEDTP